MFALERANNSLYPVVVGSVWHRCTARLGLAEVRCNVALFLISQYLNLIQFGESDGATRCAQMTQLLVAVWAQHSDVNALVVIQLHILNVWPSADRLAQFDVLVERASNSCDNGHVQVGDDISCPSSLYNYWHYLESMQDTASDFSDYQGQDHKIEWAKAVNRAMPAKRCVFQSSLSPCLADWMHVKLLRGCYLWECLYCCTACRRSCFCCWAHTGTQAGSCRAQY